MQENNVDRMVLKADVDDYRSAFVSVIKMLITTTTTVPVTNLQQQPIKNFLR